MREKIKVENQRDDAQQELKPEGRCATGVEVGNSGFDGALCLWNRAFVSM